MDTLLARDNGGGWHRRYRLSYEGSDSTNDNEIDGQEQELEGFAWPPELMYFQDKTSQHVRRRSNASTAGTKDAKRSGDNSSKVR